MVVDYLYISGSIAPSGDVGLGRRQGIRPFSNICSITKTVLGLQTSVPAADCYRSTVPTRC